MTLVNRYIGAPIERVEDLRFLRGRGEYVADLVREGMLHAAIRPFSAVADRTMDHTTAYDWRPFRGKKLSEI